MDGKTLARLGVVAFVAVAITASVIELTRKEETTEIRTVSRPHVGDPGSLRATLRHCRDMGEAASRDASCLKAWAENRDRFLGTTSPEAH
ncbi:conjugative transfer region protein TrbK [Pseudoxanthobacter soli DSM 19599]|jgi:conjugative transfer region protein TrbK|uniref:Conjugative transfer region protein TrbK n=1 Tax=Pseudoxanthobacter soli DSM 19599 TaxID=1123029 RepID=A0A1M7Z8T2_9HYPH|nr:putative entry exclusion protein TrbK-alt [Pseudoxanthobacter soli]SHO61202.1 conjugative transfer region protein TrbK [Pseudoxanthobacter soli DSM 19599]